MFSGGCSTAGQYRGQHVSPKNVWNRLRQNPNENPVKRSYDYFRDHVGLITRSREQIMCQSRLPESCPIRGTSYVKAASSVACERDALLQDHCSIVLDRQGHSLTPADRIAAPEQRPSRANCPMRRRCSGDRARGRLHPWLPARGQRQRRVLPPMAGLRRPRRAVEKQAAVALPATAGGHPRPGRSPMRHAPQPVWVKRAKPAAETWVQAPALGQPAEVARMRVRPDATGRGPIGHPRHPAEMAKAAAKLPAPAPAPALAAPAFAEPVSSAQPAAARS
jgi:hypothetical protein